MKRTMAMILVLVLMVSMIPNVSAIDYDTLTADDRNYPGFYGRLVVESVGINVALYDDISQAVCDRADSACFFTLYDFPGIVIADHSDQAFSVLTSVEVGATAEIQLGDGGVIHLRCVEAFNGHNTGDFITDNDGNIVFGEHDYLTYTCMNGWTNVRVCQWDTVSRDVVDPDYDSGFCRTAY